MPAAVTHVFVGLALGEVIRRKFFPKYSQLYVLVCGIAALFPDIDVALYFVLKLFWGNSVYFDQVHRGFTHTIFVPLIFLLSGLAALYLKKEKPFVLLYMAAVGTLSHVVLDFVMSTRILLFYPFLTDFSGLGLLPDSHLGRMISLSMDAVILTLWLVYAYWKGFVKRFF